MDNNSATFSNEEVEPSSVPSPNDQDTTAAALRFEAEKSLAHAYEAAADFMKELASEK